MKCLQAAVDQPDQKTGGSFIKLRDPALGSSNLTAGLEAWYISSGLLDKMQQNTVLLVQLWHELGTLMIDRHL